jgi:hypothetical protein
VIGLLRCDSADPGLSSVASISHAWSSECGVPPVMSSPDAWAFRTPGDGTALGSSRAARPRRGSPVRDDGRVRDTLCSLCGEEDRRTTRGSSPAARGQAASCRELAAAAGPQRGTHGRGSRADNRISSCLPRTRSCGLVAPVAAPGTPSGEPKNRSRGHVRPGLLRHHVGGVPGWPVLVLV